MVESALEVEDLTKSYGKVAAVNSLSFDVNQGEIFGLLGPNGCGKSTTLHLITGLLPCDFGSVRICGTSITDKRSRQQLGFAPDDLPLPNALTGWEYLALHDRLRGIETSERAQQLAYAWGISDALDRLVSHYSHGMKRKLQLTAALTHLPALLILDEPFRGLDPEAAGLLREMITEYASGGRSVLMATHDMIRAEKQCDRVLILCDGEIAACGSPGALCESYEVGDLETVFLKATGRESEYASRETALRKLVTGLHF